MDDTKWNETLPRPKYGSDDTDIGWTSGDTRKDGHIHGRSRPFMKHEG